MPNPIQLIVFRLIRKVIRTLWSLLLLVITLGAGYYIGQRWGATAGEPNGMWYGLAGGFAVWALFLRPRRRRRRRRRRDRFDQYTSDDGDGSSWFGDDGDSDGGGGDD